MLFHVQGSNHGHTGYEAEVATTTVTFISKLISMNNYNLSTWKYLEIDEIQ
jgi:hypothetical protein